VAKKLEERNGRHLSHAKNRNRTIKTKRNGTKKQRMFINILLQHFILQQKQSTDMTMAILSLSGFWLIIRGTSRLLWTPRLVSCIDCVVMTTSRTPLQHCIGYVCQNGSISRWLSRHFGCCMVLLHHIWVSWLALPTCPVVADFVHRHHNYCKSRHSVGLLSDVAHFL